MILISIDKFIDEVLKVWKDNSISRQQIKDALLLEIEEFKKKNISTFYEDFNQKYLSKELSKLFSMEVVVNEDGLKGTQKKQ